MTLPLPRPEVFAFFADARNLQLITPPELRFRITRAPEQMGRGAVLEYRLALFGVPFGWRTEISRWEPPLLFTDEQRSGPYRVWQHRHSFEEIDAGTRMSDGVRYVLPFAPAGEVVGALVRAQLRRIFDYREAAIRRHLLAGHAR